MLILSLSYPTEAASPSEGLSAAPNSSRLVSQVGGISYAVDISNNTAYLGLGPCLFTFDVTDPSSPQAAGSSNLGGVPQAVALAGNYAYVGDYTGIFHVLDVTDSYQPVQLGSTTVTGSINDLAVSGSYAYVCAGGKLVTIDISTAAVTGLPFGVTVLDNYAYVSAGTSGLRIVHIADPGNPQEVSTLAAGNARDMVINGHIAFIGAYNSTLTVASLANPDQPASLESFNAVGQTTKLAASGQNIFLAHTTGGLVILDYWPYRYFLPFTSR